MRNVFVIMIICLAFAGVTSAQYYGPPTNPRDRMGGRPYTSSQSLLTFDVYKVLPKDSDYDLNALVYDINFVYNLSQSGSSTGTSFGGGYTGGNADFELWDEAYDYRLKLFGGYAFNKELTLNGRFDFGKVDVAGREEDFTSFAAGLDYIDPGSRTIHGFKLEGGTLETSMGGWDYWGVEVTGVEEPATHSWIKWYYGSINATDEQYFLRTDISFPLQPPDRSGFALLVQWINVNTHIDSPGAPQIMAYGSLMGDWTKHQEYWLKVIFGKDARMKSWDFEAGYGYYSAPATHAHYDSTLWYLQVGYSF